MRFELFVARRYLTRGRRNSFLSIMSVVSIIGIAIGVAALVIALSLINGFQTDIRNKILSSTAHIMITPRLGQGLDKYAQWGEKIKTACPEVARVMPVVYGTVLLRGGGRDSTGAVFRGLDLRRSREIPWLHTLTAGRLPQSAGEVLVGRDLADKLGLFPGDSCMIIAPQPVLTPRGIVPKYRNFTVSGIFRSGLFEFDSATLVSDLAAAQHLFRLPDQVHYLQVDLHDIFRVDAAAARLTTVLPAEMSVITWKELNASLYSALKLEKVVLFFTLTLIIVVASLNIIAGLVLLVMQKIKDIGILLSFGTSPAAIRRIFLVQGSIIGVLGTAVGTTLGLTFCALANRFHWIKVPADIYQVSYVPFHINAADLAAIVGASLLISFLATLIPSGKAAGVNVVNAVKYE